MPTGKHKNHVRGAEHPRYKGRNKKDPLYRAWLSMRNRCNNPRCSDYSYYGGRGITVCPQWDNYDVFAADVGPHPGNGMTLDRIDGALGYAPGNVRWASRLQQARNRTYCKITLEEQKCIREAYWSSNIVQVTLAKMYGVSQGRISAIIRGA